MKILNAATIAVMVLSSYHVVGLTIDLQGRVIDKEAAGELGISVVVLEDELECSRVLDIYVAIPIAYRGSSLHTVMLEIKRDEQVLLETSLRTVTLTEYMGLVDFHGVNIRLHDNSFESLELKVTYGQGTSTTELLILPIMDLMR